VVAVLVERVLPAPLPDDPKQGQFARMHMRIAVVRLVLILGRIVGVHVVRHRAAVDHEIDRVVGLGRHVQAATRGAGRAASLRRDLRQRLDVNVGIDLGELEQVFPAS